MSTTIKRLTSRMLSRHRSCTFSSHRSIIASRDSNILTSIYKDIPKLNCSLNDFLWVNIDKWHGKTATVCGISGRSYTYAQLHKTSTLFAASLRNKLRLQTNDTVAIVLPNVPDYPSIMMGILQAGCIATTVNPIYTSYEIKRQIEMLDCKAIIATKLSYGNISEALIQLKRNTPVILLENDSLPEGTIKFAELVDPTTDTSCLKSVRRSADDVAVIPFSSGTTGLPKGVILTHGNVVAINQMISDPDIKAVEDTTETNQSVLPAVLPFFHIFGMSVLMLSQMHLGCKLVTLPMFKPEVFLKTLVEHKATSVFIVPPMAVFLGKHPAVSAKHLETVKSVICGAAPLSDTDAEALLQKNSKMIVRQGYGLTETTGALCIGSNKGRRNLASVGHVMPNCEVKFADLNTGQALPAGKEGELWFRGPNKMRGYYNDKAANDEVFTADGWFKTGDIGSYDQDKCIYITDRLKELIKVKGYQVAPAELEGLLRTHPKVLDCAVIGVPDSVSGEVPKAFVVSQPGVTIAKDEIVQFINTKVTSYKKIKDAQIVEAIPKNAAGKILRKDIKKMYC